MRRDAKGDGMRQISRYIRSGLSLLSLLLCLAMAAVWARSYQTSDELRQDKTSVTDGTLTRRWLNVVSSRGGIGLNLQSELRTPPEMGGMTPASGTSYYWRRSADQLYGVSEWPHAHRFLGFYFYRGRGERLVGGRIGMVHV